MMGDFARVIVARRVTVPGHDPDQRMSRGSAEQRSSEMLATWRKQHPIDDDCNLCRLAAESSPWVS
jgi:hypothetical protein